VGARFIKRGEKRAAYIPMFSCVGMEYQELVAQQLTRTWLGKADGLVLDFRDGFGGADPTFVNLFSRAPTVRTDTDRAGKTHVYDSQWRKPLAVIINAGSASGKEAVAFSFKKNKLATLVGERTAGAVLAGQCFKLRENCLMYLAVTDVRIDGVRIEGAGVEPDVKVQDKLRYLEGEDPQLDKAVEIVTK